MCICQLEPRHQVFFFLIFIFFKDIYILNQFTVCHFISDFYFLVEGGSGEAFLNPSTFSVLRSQR